MPNYYDSNSRMLNDDTWLSNYTFSYNVNEDPNLVETISNYKTNISPIIEDILDRGARLVRKNPDSGDIKSRIKRITRRQNDDIQEINIKDVNPGDLVYLETVRENSVLMAYSKDSDSVLLVRYDGRFYNLYFSEVGDNTSTQSLAFVPSDGHIKWFVENASEYSDCPRDSDGFMCIAKVVKDRYPEQYSKLHIANCSMCGGIAIPKITVYGVTLCSDCYESNYVHCAHCGEAVMRTKAFADKRGSYLCQKCNKRHWVLPYHSYYPQVEFYGDNKGNSVPFMGFELEVDCGGESNNNVAEIMPLINKEDTNRVFAYCSRDGSLDNGFEIITQPATMQYHLSIRDVYNRAIQKLKSMGYASHETTTCGLHIHFNRSFFDSEACVERLLRMTEKFWNELCVYARRPERMATRYAKKIPNEMSIKEYVYRADKCNEHSYHYYAVNIANSDTIEIRIFRGTLNLNTLMATLQLVNNMAIFAKDKTMEEIENMKFTDLLTTHTQRKYWARRSEIMDFEE